MRIETADVEAWERHKATVIMQMRAYIERFERASTGSLECAMFLISDDSQGDQNVESVLALSPRGGAGICAEIVTALECSCPDPKCSVKAVFGAVRTTLAAEGVSATMIGQTAMSKDLQ